MRKTIFRLALITIAVLLVAVARQKAGNRGILPSNRSAGATADSAQGFHNGNKKCASLHIDCSNRAVFPWDVTKIVGITQICAKIYPHLTII